jgi:alpha-methylacyl-CoA racemase
MDHDAGAAIPSRRMGPLHGRKVIEIAGIGPVPFCGMLLADLGADVIRVDRVGRATGGLPPAFGVMTGRSKRSIAVDLKRPEGIDIVLRLLEEADVLIEGFRPGVAERLGIGPDVCRQRNPRLVYGRMTGWGQDGPLSQQAGHDLNYLGLTGGLHAIGRAGRPPPPPLNLVADYGGGALYLAMGVLAALVEREQSGNGDVVDAAMVDGAASLLTLFYELYGAGVWTNERAANLLDGAAPFYDTYETSDGKYVAVGPIESQFFAELLNRLGIEEGELPPQLDVASWPMVKARLAAIFATATRDEWEARFAGSDACVTPVLTLEEAPRHPHNLARATFVSVGGVVQPGPAPRFDRWSRPVPAPTSPPGAHTREVLGEVGLTGPELDRLEATAVVGQA